MSDENSKFGRIELGNYQYTKDNYDTLIMKENLRLAQPHAQQLLKANQENVRLQTENEALRVALTEIRDVATYRNDGREIVNIVHIALGDNDE